MLVQHPLEMVLVDDEQVIQTLSSVIHAGGASRSSVSLSLRSETDEHAIGPLRLSVSLVRLSSVAVHLASS